MEDSSDVRSFERHNSTKPPSDGKDFDHANDLLPSAIRKVLKNDPHTKAFKLSKYHMVTHPRKDARLKQINSFFKRHGKKTKKNLRLSMRIPS